MYDVDGARDTIVDRRFLSSLAMTALFGFFLLSVRLYVV